jgi:hypothetical protein
MNAYVVLEEIGNRAKPIALFFSRDDAENYCESHGEDFFVQIFGIDGEYRDGNPLYACYTFAGEYRLECFFASLKDARTHAGVGGKVTAIHPANWSGILEHDGWIEPWA